MSMRVVTRHVLVLVVATFCHDVVAGAACNWTGDFSGNAPDNVVYALAAHDDGRGEALFVGGGFINVAGQSRPYIARWDGAGWSELGTGVEFDVHAGNSGISSRAAAARIGMRPHGVCMPK